MNIENFFLWGIVGLNCLLMTISFAICAFIIFIATTYSIAAIYRADKEYSEMFDK